MRSYHCSAYVRVYEPARLAQTIRSEPTRKRVSMSSNARTGVRSKCVRVPERCVLKCACPVYNACVRDVELFSLRHTGYLDAMIARQEAPCTRFCLGAMMLPRGRRWMLFRLMLLLPLLERYFV